ncbi:hypothetical protein Tco_1547148 [Tanacetum coccineum]
MGIIRDLVLYDNESWNNPRDFAKPFKAIALPQDVLSTSERRLIELENQVQRLMEARLALIQPTQVNKITTSCEICSGPHDTQYCMEDPEQAFSAHSYPTQDPQCSNHVHGSINAITIHPKQPEGSQVNRPDEGQEEEGNLGNTSSNPHPQSDLLASIATKQVRKLNSMLESLILVPQSSNTKFVCSKEDDGEVMFIEIIRYDDEPQNKGPNEGEGATTEGPVVEYFDTFPTRDELTYHKYLMCGLTLSIFLRNPIITEGYPSNLKIPCNIRHVHVEKTYIDINSPQNIMTRMMYNWIMRRKLSPREDANRGVCNFTEMIKGMHVFVGNFTYIVYFMIIEDISLIIDPRLSQVVLEKHFAETSNMTHDPQEGVVRFTNRNDEVAYKMPYKIEQYNSLSNLEKAHTKSVYLRNEEDKRIWVEYVMRKILGFYKECIEFGPEYLTGRRRRRSHVKTYGFDVVDMNKDTIDDLLLKLLERLVLFGNSEPLNGTNTNTVTPSPVSHFALPAKQAQLVVYPVSHMAQQAQTEPTTVTLGSVGPTAAPGQATTFPHAFTARALHDPASDAWNMDTCASSHLNDSLTNLSEVFNSCMYPSVSVGDGHSIPVTNMDHSILPTSVRPLHLNNVLITHHIVKNLVSVC